MASQVRVLPPPPAFARCASYGLAKAAVYALRVARGLLLAYRAPDRWPPDETRLDLRLLRKAVSYTAARFLLRRARLLGSNPRIGACAARQVRQRSLHDRSQGFLRSRLS